MKQWDAKLSRKVVHTVVTIIVTMIIVGGGAFAYLFFKQDTQTSLKDNPGKALITNVKATNAANKSFTEAGFTFNLPADWKKTNDVSTGTYRRYGYQATLKNADNRFLYIYVDHDIPTTMAVNKVVAVHPQGTKLSHGEVSGQCTDFTNQTTPASHTVTAKWDGVDFLCDMDSRASNVVGTSSPGMVNKVELQDAGFTPRDFFFLYEDDNYTPDYGIFYNFLDSFTVQ